MPRYLECLLLGLALWLSSRAASAEPDSLSLNSAGASETRETGTRQDFLLTAGLGGFSNHTLSGVDLSVLGAMRYDFIEGGVLIQGGSEIFGGTYVLFGGAAGLGLQAENGLRLDLQGVVAADSYSGIGCGLFCDSGGAAATLPWAGGRLELSQVFQRDRHVHFQLGLAVTAGTDIGRTTVNYETAGTGIFGDTTSSQDTVTLGSPILSIQLAVGVVFDVSR